ncbi:Serine/threonine-protein kinase, active site [Sesbania bispinosa]|nr:Serine/threonine-protein kinase, active site [Sesbania bispinosa]
MAFLALSGTNFTTDKLALVALKSSITSSDPYHILSHNWSASSPVCNWVGVTCDAHHYGRVRTLNLADMGLSGTIPSELGNLTFLIELDIGGNSFHGELPQQLVHLRRLKSLNLSYNEFSGDVPTWIGGLSSLQHLYLRNNKFGGFIPKSFSNLTMLEILALDHNLIEGTIPPEVGKMTHLWILSISSNKLKGSIPQTFSNLSSLEKISLSYNSLTGGIPREIGEIPQLRVMYLGNNPLSGSIPSTIFNHSMLQDIELGSSNLSSTLPSNLCLGLPKLQILYVGFNKISGKIPSVWHQCKELTDVELSNNMFSRGGIPGDIGNLTKLASLYLDEDNLEGLVLYWFWFWGLFLWFGLEQREIPFSLFNISSMRVISLEKNKLNGSLTEEMFHQLPFLEFLALDNNQFVGSIPKSISNCSMLQELYLGDNSFSGSIPEEIGVLPILSNLTLGRFLPSQISLENLEELYLYDNQLHGNIPSSLSNASKLNYLDLKLNKFNGAIPNALGELRYLEQLDVGYNNLTTDASTIELSFLTSLNFLQISGNPMHGHLSKSIGNMSNLEQFIADSCSIIATIQGLQSLQYLSLGNNQLKGTIIDELCAMNQLSELYITENELISGGIPTCFGNLTSLRKVYLNSNKLNQVPSSLWSLKDILEISGSIPRDIARLQNLQILNLAHNKLLGNIPDSFGTLPNGMAVAIKLFNLDLEFGSKSFHTECEAMRNLRHRNLIKIIGSCSNVDYKLLVMEFMPNGSLESWLYSHNNYLDFLQRLNIMIDVASALDYMHHGSMPTVVHCDVKPNNVLLDEDMVAHVSDFGIAKLLDEEQSKEYTKTIATLGYIAPEYGSKGTISTKGDVYSFGIMLMKKFTRKKPTDELFVVGLSMKGWIYLKNG